VLTILGANFANNPLDMQVLLAGGVGFADVTAVGPQTIGAELNTGLSATVFSVGNTASGPVTLVQGTGSNVAGQNLNTAGIVSNSTLVRQLVDGVGINFGSFNLTPGSSNTTSVNSGTPMPGGLTLDMTATGTNSVLEYRFGLKSSDGKLFVFQGRITFVGTPSPTQKALHLASHLNTSFMQPFSTLGVSASTGIPSSSHVRISTAGAAYGGVVVSGK